MAAHLLFGFQRLCGSGSHLYYGGHSVSGCRIHFSAFNGFLALQHRPPRSHRIRVSKVLLAWWLAHVMAPGRTLSLVFRLFLAAGRISLFGVQALFGWRSRFLGFILSMASGRIIFMGVSLFMAAHLFFGFKGCVAAHSCCGGSCDFWLAHLPFGVQTNSGFGSHFHFGVQVCYGCRTRTLGFRLVMACAPAFWGSDQ